VIQERVKTIKLHFIPRVSWISMATRFISRFLFFFRKYLVSSCVREKAKAHGTRKSSSPAFTLFILSLHLTSIFSETPSGNMDEIRRLLPKELYLLLIDKYFEQSSCVSLVLSDSFDGFSSVYTPSRFVLVACACMCMEEAKCSHLSFCVIYSGSVRGLWSMSSVSSSHLHHSAHSSVITSP